MHNTTRQELNNLLDECTKANEDLSTWKKNLAVGALAGVAAFGPMSTPAEPKPVPSANVQVASQYSIPADLWKGLMGEAVGEGYEGMYAVACAVRNRLKAGIGHGLVAMKRKDLDTFIAEQGKEHEDMAKDIVKKVFVENAPDTTDGATHFESEDYPEPYWAPSMDKTVKIGKHQFYRKR